MAIRLLQGRQFQITPLTPRNERQWLLERRVRRAEEQERSAVHCVPDCAG